MKFHHLALKEARGKLFGLMLILGALWFLGMEVGSTEATMHWGNPCFARGSYSGSGFSNFFVFSLLVLGVFIFFGSTISKKVKSFIRPRRRR